MSVLRSSGSREPRSVKDIAKTAADFVYEPAVPFPNWLRAARSCRQQAEIYEAEGDLERAYELYFRQVVLVLEKLPRHPQAKLGRNAAALGAAQKDAQISLTRCEQLKPLIQSACEEYEKRRHVRELQAARRKAEASHPQGRPGSSGSYTRLSGDFGGRRYTEYEGTHDQAVALEIARGDQRSSGYPRRIPVRAGDDIGLSQQMQGIRLQLEGKQLPRNGRQQISDERRSKPVHWAYPSVPESQPSLSGSQKELWLGSTGQVRQDDHPEPLRINAPPMLPGKQPLHSNIAPIRPPKDSSSPTFNPPIQHAPQLPPKSPPSLNTTSETRVFKPAAFLENGSPLRTIFLPPQMRLDFLKLAQSNTLRNLETCGILAGTLKSNALFVEMLVIPDQESTSDTCEMTDEGEISLFDYCESHDLLTLGWIHTHPTQTCFMSSRDLHTHCGYQAMMPESIAIVCAPSLNEWGAFRLTDPPGMKVIQTCKKPGIFHPHDVDNVYTEATRPGHVVLLDGLGYNVHDMRK